MTNQEQYELICEKAKKYDRLVEVFDKMRTEIEKPLRDERCFDTADAKAQAIALNWCLEIIDKHLKEIGK